MKFSVWRTKRDCLLAQLVCEAGHIILIQVWNAEGKRLLYPCFFDTSSTTSATATIFI